MRKQCGSTGKHGCQHAPPPPSPHPGAHAPSLSGAPPSPPTHLQPRVRHQLLHHAAQHRDVRLGGGEAEGSVRMRGVKSAALPAAPGPATPTPPLRRLCRPRASAPEQPDLGVHNTRRASKPSKSGGGGAGSLKVHGHAGPGGDQHLGQDVLARAALVRGQEEGGAKHLRGAGAGGQQERGGGSWGSSGGLGAGWAGWQHEARHAGRRAPRPPLPRLAHRPVQRGSPSTPPGAPPPACC